VTAQEKAARWRQWKEGGDVEQERKAQERQSRFIGAREVAADTGCSVGHAYTIIKRINDKLEAEGYIIPRHGHTLRRAYYEMTGGE